MGRDDGARHLGDVEHIRCLSPPATLADADGAPFEARALEVTVNSQLRALTAGAVLFTYVAPAAVTVSRVYPRGVRAAAARR